MEKIHIETDKIVFYIQADCFPEGVLSAHQQLHSLVPFQKERNYFGISRPENGSIIYRAAMEELIPGEAEKYACKKMVIKKGFYKSLTVENYMENIPKIGAAFQIMTQLPEIDKEGYCVEWYVKDDVVKCMVRLEE